MKTKIALSIIIILALLPVSHSAPAQWPTITAENLLIWLDASVPPLVLDVRGQSVYRTGTLVGAFNAGTDPLGYLPGDGMDRVILIIPEDADQVFIKSWFKRLTDFKHKVWILKRGLSAWVDAGGQIHKPEVTYTSPGSVPFIIPRGLCEGNKPAQVFE